MNMIQKVGLTLTVLTAIISSIYSAATFLDSRYISNDEFVTYAIGVITTTWNLEIEKIERELEYEQGLIKKDEKRIEFLKKILITTTNNRDYYYKTGNVKIGELIVRPNSEGIRKLFNR